MVGETKLFVLESEHYLDVEIIAETKTEVVLSIVKSEHKERIVTINKTDFVSIVDYVDKHYRILIQMY